MLFRLDPKWKSGRGGKILRDIQAQTMTMIHLSARGEYLSGKNQRIAFISGSSPDIVDNAMYLIHQRLSTSNK